MSSEELRFVNAFIGFCIPTGGTWPSPFVEADYEITGLEHEVATIVNGRPQSPTPELICSSSQVQHCVLLEAKSGSVRDQQARGYKAITSEQLVGQGLAASEVRATDACVDVIYMTQVHNSRRLSDDFGRAGVDFPMIVSDGACFKLYEGSIENDHMHRTFLDGVLVDEDAWPMGFVRCDRDSSDGDLAAICIQAMVSLLLRCGEVNIEPLAAQSIDLWDQRGNDDKRRFRRRLAALLNEAAATEFRGEIERDRLHQRWIRTGKRRLAAQSLDRISELAAQFVQRKQEGRPFREGQPPLFDYAAEE